MMAALSATLIFASCKKEEGDGQGQTEQHENQTTQEFVFSFKDVVDWEPKSIHTGYYTYDADTVILVMLSRDEKSAEEIIMEMDEMDGINYPDGIAVFEFRAKEGSVSGVLDPMSEEDVEAYSMVLLGTENYGTQEIPVVWFSESYDVSVSMVDFENNKVSATFNASMQDMMAYYMGMGGEAKPLSLVMSNYPIQNFDVYFEEGEDEYVKFKKMLSK
jgi:hypothetical protein